MGRSYFRPSSRKQWFFDSRPGGGSASWADSATAATSFHIDFRSSTVCSALSSRRAAGLGARGRVVVWRPLAANVRSIGIAAILILIAVAMTPLGLMAAAPLENRFPQPTADIPPPFGIIVLGGAVNGPVSKARGEIVFDEGERMIEAASLAKGYLRPEWSSPADAAR
jgi:hypothetical protein